MLCVAFDTKEHHITLCLRDEKDHLVTQATLHDRVTEHALLVYVSYLQLYDMVEKIIQRADVRRQVVFITDH